MGKLQNHHDKKGLLKSYSILRNREDAHLITFHNLFAQGIIGLAEEVLGVEQVLDIQRPLMGEFFPVKPEIELEVCSEVGRVFHRKSLVLLVNCLISLPGSFQINGGRILSPGVGTFKVNRQNLVGRTQHPLFA